MSNKTIIAVIGHMGMVGSTVYNYFKNLPDYEVMGLSISNQTHNLQQINDRADWIFVCVPTPFVWEKDTYDLSILRGVLKQIKGTKKVCIKSTIVPGTTEALQKEFPELYILFNPEFLSEKTAEADFLNPDRQIVGYTKRSYKYSMTLLNMLPMSAYGILMTATEGEICKYVNNFNGALMVIFANLIYDICEKTGSDYDKIRKASEASKWVGSPMGRMYWNVNHAGFRGYGGKCFPKDINALLKWCEEKGVKNEVLKATKEANVRILANQDLNEKQVENMSSRNV